MPRSALSGMLAIYTVVLCNDDPSARLYVHTDLPRVHVSPQSPSSLRLYNVFAALLC